MRQRYAVLTSLHSVQVMSPLPPPKFSCGKTLGKWKGVIQSREQLPVAPLLSVEDVKEMHNSIRRRKRDVSAGFFICSHVRLVDTADSSRQGAVDSKSLTSLSGGDVEDRR